MRFSLTQIFKLTLACVLLAPALSLAEDGGCEKVFDKDKQVICMATSKKEVKLCDGMSSSNGKYFCQAVSAGNSYPCEKISGSRSYCLAQVRDKQRKG
jgi:hypothetical protein